MRRWVVALVLVGAVSLGTGLAAATPQGTTRVTMIGDSVADELAYVSSAQATLAKGVHLQLQLAACRRLVQPSCTVAGVQPQTAYELVRALGPALGPVVVVSVGYNDDELLFPHDVEQVLGALHAAGVQRILWLTLRATRHTYVAMNDELRGMAHADGHVTVVDWNRYSRSHPSWFVSDGLHLTPAGAIAMARLVHAKLVGLQIAAPGTHREPLSK